MISMITLTVKQQLLYRLRYLLFLSVLVLSSLSSQAQLVLNSAHNNGTYSDRISITLDSGFTSEPTGSQSLVLYIDTTVVGPLAEKPSNSRNYVVTYTPRVPGISNPADTTLTNAQVMVGIQYTDGLGRPLQNIQVKGSPHGNDMVQPFAYDTTGRQTTQFLPYMANGINDGAYRSAALTEQTAYYNPSAPGANNIATTAYPFAQTRYELSPLNRPLEQGAPGADWQLGAHTRGIVYTTNSDTTLTSGGHWAKNYIVRADTLAADSAYYPGELTVTITHDENWTSGNGRLGTTETYTDKNERTILKRTFNYNAATSGNEILSTYYVYDNFGNLRYIVPPSADPDNPVGVPSKLVQNSQCYKYIYDDQNHLIGKKIPGRGVSYILYNKLDRPVIAQDSMLRDSTKWAVLKYDMLGRLIMSGAWDAGSSPALTVLQDSINKDTAFDKRDTTNTTTGYTITSYPAISHPLTINYYDDYNIPNLPAAYDLHTDTAYSHRTRGLLTATRTAILKSDGSISSDMLWTVYYYDNKGRNIKTFKQHYLGGVQSVYNYDEASAGYDFTGTLTRAVRNHYAKNSGNTAAVLGVALKDSVVYDHAGRMVQTWNQINNGTKVLVNKIDYNELGQAATRHMHSTNNGSTFLQDVGYAYNERGWLTKNSAPMFAEQLKYNDGTTPQYNGNIANQLWGKPGSLGNTFTYAYDKLDRLTSGSSATMSESGISYDLAGNIQSLTRDGNTISYTYDSKKQLASVSGTGVQSGTYTYDGNGNVVNDGSNGYAFTSNMLDLPRQVTNGSQTISYTYDAMGNKLSKSSTATGLTEYVNGIQYGSNTGSYGIDFIPISGGRAVRKTDGSYRYEYGLPDHLGNVRAVIQQNPTTLAADTIQRDEYYPFGLRHSLLAGDNKYLYNGKEVQEEINQYDYGARFYNPAIGRWNGVDQMAEVGPEWSPYSYVVNNPINYIDPDGRWAYDKDKNIVPENKDDDYYTLEAFLAKNGLDASALPDVYGDMSYWEGANTKYGMHPGDNPFDKKIYISAGTFAPLPDNDRYNYGPGYTGSGGSGSLDGNGGNTVNPGTAGGTGGGGSANQGGATGQPQTSKDNSSFWTHLIGPGILGLVTPIPKPFVAINSTPYSTILSNVLRKVMPQKILLENGERRIFTHMLNGSPRYANTWGGYYGRVLAEPLGILGVSITVMDVMHSIQQATIDSGHPEMVFDTSWLQ